MSPRNSKSRKSSRRRIFAAACAENLEPRRLLSTFVVNNTNDSGTGSLRSALAQANTNPGNDTISFDSTIFTPGTLHTITLTGGQLTLSDTTGQTTIQGPGQDTLTIDANHVSRSFKVNAGVIANLSGMNLINGHIDASSSKGGGAIFNDGSLSLSNCTLSQNTVTNSITFTFVLDEGGAVFNDGSLTLTNCILSANSATSPIIHYTSINLIDYTGVGGAIFSSSPSSNLSLINCTLSNNIASAAGGAIMGSGTLTNCTLATNSSTYLYGGAIDINGAEGTSVINCSFTGNTTGGNGGAIFSDTPLSLAGSSFTGNSANSNGGAIESATDGFSLNNSTFTGNTAVYGGGAVALYGENMAIIGQCTFTNNTAATGGAIIYSDYQTSIAVLNISNSNFSGNSAQYGGGASINPGSFDTGSTTYITKVTTNLSNCTFAGNIATVGTGGAINNAPSGSATAILNITACTIRNNTAPNGDGGGIYNAGSDPPPSLRL